jgi:ketosteroid isomerase-like protein
MFRTTLLGIAILASLLPSALAQQPSVNPPEDFRAAENHFREALLKSDTATLSKILTDDFLRTPPTTARTTKAQYLEALRTGSLKYLSIETQEAKYRTYGNTVLVDSVAALRVRINGQETEVQLRLLSVWIKQNGRWLLAAVQGNQMPTPQR